MQMCGMIAPDSVVRTCSDDGGSVDLYLVHASIHDQNLFNTAIAELLSPIENPRYILVKQNLFGRNRYAVSYACPSVIGQKKEYAELLCDSLKAIAGRFNLFYTRREDGRQLILKCRKRSYITFGRKITDQKFKVSDFR